MIFIRKLLSARAAILAALAALILAAAWPLVAQARDVPTLPAHADSAQAKDTPKWLEPRGLSVLDLVGQVPEEHLRGSILVFREAGVTRYLSGKREGDQVTIEVSMSPFRSLATEISCLGRRPLFDEWPVTVPPSTMRVYSAGQDVTDKVYQMFWYFPAAQEKPIRGARPTDGKAERYREETDVTVSRTPAGDIIVPANMGCLFFLFRDFPDLTATFVFDYPQQIVVEEMGQQTFTFHSYIGVGDAGRLAPLRDQLMAKFGPRHDKFQLTIPAGADYVWLNYPPTPVSPYATQRVDENILLPSSGTYRLIGALDTKSTDHVVSMGLPLAAQWMDADVDFGSWLSKTQQPIEMISAPEYFVPPGVAYDPCMREGGCPDELLDRIYNTPAQMTLYYYRVRRLLTSEHMRVPLRQVAGDWQPNDTQAANTTRATSLVTTTIPNLRLPLVLFLSDSPTTYPDDLPQEGCPCGWFDEYFRMLDVIPGVPEE